ncbi:LacI family transcriptional regulator [Christensenellaceae bacterium OttesenSCG-928-K19]|nr:LacI family transcriptional regulator [Christensenellaceae bacterium OttesenSCG-928-K19]
MSKITIRDIAKLANVSTTAVSFVLNGKEGVSKETRQRILDIMEQTNFIPNAHTRRLNLKRSFNIHLVIRQYESKLRNMFSSEITFGILKASEELGYNIVTTNIRSGEKNRLTDYIRNKDTDGFIFINDAETSLLSQVEVSEMPFVVVDSHAPDSVSYPQVKADYFEAAYQATQYLIQKRHHKIAFIGTDALADYYVNTFGGYQKCMSDNALAFPSDWIQPGATDEETARACMQAILDSGNTPTAVFCAGDIFAIGAMRCVKESGLRVPGDISFVGLDDVVISRYIEPPLTTVSVNEELMGQMAMQTINKIISGKPFDKVTLTPSTLVERESVRDLR